LMQRKVAIKFVLGFAANPNAAERFVREARVTQSLQDEHVVRVYDLGVLESGTPYLVMEYLEGQDLAHLLHAHGRFPADIAVDYVLGACEALAEAHAAGIVHRDIKPSNLILIRRKNGTPLIKVVDFGISKVLDSDDDAEKSLTGSVAMLGSPLYMSPEQIRSARSIDARADVWALGVTLYSCLTGEPPFDGEGVHGVCASIVADPPRPFPEDLELPEGLEEILSRCLAKRPEERTQSVVELATELGPFATKRGRLSADRISTLYAPAAPESAQRWQPKLESEATLDAEGSAPRELASSAATELTEATLNHPTSQTIDRPPGASRRRYWIPALVALGLLLAGAAIGRLAGSGPTVDAAAATAVEHPTETPSSVVAVPETTRAAEPGPPGASAEPEPAPSSAASSGKPAQAPAPHVAKTSAPLPQPAKPRGNPAASDSAKSTPHTTTPATPPEPAPVTDDDGFPIPD
ncbi:MAG: protein kinase, partial [Myxococcales bacterium]|nr:protein kinase [Myxococcales bacterium]